MSAAPKYTMPVVLEVAHCHGLLDAANVSREIPQGREAGLIERVSWLVNEVNRLKAQGRKT